MASSDFLPFAGGGSANVLSQADWAALTSVVQNGFPSGILLSVRLNKALRQSSIMAAVLAQFIADRTGVNSVDDGTIATLLANLKGATGGVAPVTAVSSNGVSIGASANIQLNTTSFTAPANGSVYITGSLNLGAVASANIVCALYATVAGVVSGALSNDSSLLPQSHQARIAVTKGQTVVLTMTVTTTTTASAVGTLRVGGFFVPA